MSHKCNEADLQQTKHYGYDVGWAKEQELLHVLCYTLFPKDRKSTRLNSSHGYISYAVFCLKKKNNKKKKKKKKEKEKKNKKKQKITD